MQKLNPIRVKNMSSPELKYFKELFVRELKLMYWSEKQQLKVLHRLAKASSTKYLKACFNGHLRATRSHVNRLEKIFFLLNENNVSKRCTEIDALISEAAAVTKNTARKTLLRDLALIELAKKMESLEFVKYNRLINSSNELGNFEVTLLLEETLIEEQEAKETFEAVMEDTLMDEMFSTENVDAELEATQGIEELEAV